MFSPAQKPKDPMEASIGNERAPRPRILVIDDAEVIHDDFRKILAVEPVRIDQTEVELFGPPPTATFRAVFEVDSAHQGQEGLTMVERARRDGRPYALAFVDVRMPPGWDGIETTTRLWEADPDLQVVICTAYSDYSWGEMTEQLGAPDSLLILKKPFDTVEVLQLTHAMTKNGGLPKKPRTASRTWTSWCRNGRGNCGSRINSWRVKF